VEEIGLGGDGEAQKANHGCETPGKVHRH
jgi:hypothetical protein